MAYKLTKRAIHKLRLKYLFDLSNRYLLGHPYFALLGSLISEQYSECIGQARQGPASYQEASRMCQVIGAYIQQSSHKRVISYMDGLCYLPLLD